MGMIPILNCIQKVAAKCASMGAGFGVEAWFLLSCVASGNAHNLSGLQIHFLQNKEVPADLQSLFLF